MKNTLQIYVGLLLISISFGANAQQFWVTGKIKRDLVGQYYSGCMIFLDKDIGNSCPSRWVSLDCNGLFNSKDSEKGKIMFSSAMAAAHAGKTVQLLVNDANKANGYCVARRIDVIY